MFSNSYNGQLIATATKLGMKRDWLFNVIALESNWNPEAYNRSGAVGLIQFMPKTLKGMRLLSPVLDTLVPAYSDSAAVPEEVKQMVREEFLAKFPDVESQLAGPVYQYFKAYKFPTEQSVYMRVLYPALVDAPLSQTLPANVQAANPGLKTVGDYVALVQSRASRGETLRKGLPLVALAAIGAGAYFMLT